MPIEYVTGDIFETDAQTIAHGCNTRGRMGAGIALEIRRRHPAMFQQYRRLCYKRLFRPGEYFLWKESTPWILNLATQGDTLGAKPEILQRCFEDFCRYYAYEGITSLALPRVGAGLGGLEWDEVRELMERAWGGLPISVRVYSM
jgi:O-acetyl-ADP-ribose deacetylase (regulator of RNase III)